MKVQEVLLKGNKKRFILLDSKGNPVLPVIKYLKYLDNIGKSVNTLRTYCFALKYYFEYLNDINTKYNEIGLDDLANFVSWLRNPYEKNNVIPIEKVEPKRSVKTVNLYITVTTNFYDYLYKSEKIKNDLSDKLFKSIMGGPKRYKDFLYHINKSNSVKKNLLKLKEPSNKIKPLTKKQVEEIYNACTNIRDKFLIQLLLETGLRIGEALALFHEDFIDCRNYKNINSHKISLKNRGELSNGAKIKSSGREIFISQALMDFYDDYIFKIIYELNIDTNFLFVKLSGNNKGEPLEYQNISSLFRRLKKKTGIDITPHQFRHTHATVFYLATKNVKALQERLGHANVQTTMDMYVHLSNEELVGEWEKAKSKFQDLIPGEAD